MRRELKSWEPAVCMVIGGLLISLQPRLVRAQAAARVPWQSEPEWQQAYEKARLADPAGFRVESLEEFKRITVYFQQLESEGTTRHSFHTAAGDSISCIDIASQRSFLQSAAPGSQPLTSPIQPPSESDRTTRSEADASGTLRNLFGLDGSADEDGHVRACQAGTFPRLMPKLSNFYHARNLEEIFQKYPDGYRGLPPHGATNSTPADSRDPGWRPADSTTGAAIRDSSVSSPASPPTNHEYAHAAETAYNIGSQALFNLWSPFVQQNDEFSLSQLWEIQGRYSDNTLQSVEFGWQVFPNKYGDSKAHLFIYSTSAAYTAGSGCYNLDCSRFVQTSSSVVVGGSFSTYSANGGTQYEVPLVVYRDPASQNWWLKFNGTWVGYYPNSLFNASGISNFASSIDFGGEIINDAVGGVHTATQMGSGHFASGGYGTAAYIKTIQYWDTNGNLYNAGGLSPNATNPTDYNLALFSSSDPNWLTYFFFGGPGNPSANNSLPNLTPYQPTGWSAPIVATKQAGTTADASSITSSDNLFVDWAVQNSGAATITPFFNVQLLIDGSINQTWATTQPLQAGYFISVKDYSIGALSPGNHTLKIVADSTNAVAESNEGDNSYTKTINVLGSSGQSCVPSGAVLCIDGQPGDRRYQIQANFQTAQGGGSSGNGHAIPLSSLGITHGGLFWFFSADNPEITIKVLPTCSFSSHPWVFASALTNVAFTITVTDMKTGVRSTYTNADGHLAGPIQDTGTLPCP